MKRWGDKENIIKAVQTLMKKKNRTRKQHRALATAINTIAELEADDLVEIADYALNLCAAKRKLEKKAGKGGDQS